MDSDEGRGATGRLGNGFDTEERREALAEVEKVLREIEGNIDHIREYVTTDADEAGCGALNIRDEAAQLETAIDAALDTQVSEFTIPEAPR